MHTQLPYWLAFSRLPHLGPVRIKKIAAQFPNLNQAWHDLPAVLAAISLDRHHQELVLAAQPEIVPEQLLAELDRHRLQAVCLADDSYPPLLKEIYDPPPVLYYQGELPQAQLLAIVGTRNISSYGAQIIKNFIPDITAHGLATVSGMALGIDGQVHLETIASGGTTFAVLGGGLDRQNIYPSSHRYLAEKIISAAGGLISEYPPGTLPLPQHFPRRNRIISGAARGVLVVEGDIDSGSLITARAALEQGREVMAVPGSIYARGSRGTNQLLQAGAHPITQPSDIMNALDLEYTTQTVTPPPPPADSVEEKILGILTPGPLSTDEIIRLSSLPTAQIIATLSMMEIKKMIHTVRPNVYMKAG